MVGQFVTRAPHRGRSAYLRTLAVAHDSWNLPDRLVKARAGVALPFDPTLAMLRPQRPAWIPDWGMTAKPEAATISEFLEEMTRRLQTTSSDDILLALSLPLRITETEIIEIEVIRWIQWSTAPIDPPELMARRDGKTKELGLWEMKDLTPTILCPVSALDDVVDANTCAAPTAHKPFMSRHGYLHADLYSRGIPLPLSTTTTVQVSAHPLDGELEIRAEDTHLGRANYWNAGWDTSYPRLGHAFCGTALVADATRLDLLWLQQPLRHFFLWRCTSLLRENSYSAYSSKELIGAHFVCSNQ